MIPAELYLVLEREDADDEFPMSYWLKAFDAPERIRRGDFVNDTAAPAREELLMVSGTHFNLLSRRLTVLVEGEKANDLADYELRMRELRAADWYELEDPFVYKNPLPAVERPGGAAPGVAVEWRLRLHSRLPAPDGGSCWVKKSIERTAPVADGWTPMYFTGLVGAEPDAPIVKVFMVIFTSGTGASIAEVFLTDSSIDRVNAALLTATGWQLLPCGVERWTSLGMEEGFGRIEEESTADALRS